MSFFFSCLSQNANAYSVALKVHHDGLLKEQPDQLAAETGVPGIQDDIVDSDMAHSNGNGVYSNGYNEETQTA